jgi:subtilisin-like proprotein convertase family protein
MPDAGALNFPLHVTATGIVDEVRVTIDLVHPDVSQITADLVSPVGTTVRLADRGGPRGANFDGTVFAAAAVVPVNDGAAPFVGTFAPAGSLTSLQGQGLAGTWTLRVTDTREDFLSGTVRAWSLDLFSPAPPPSYASWASVHFPGGGSGSAPQDDHNQDGFANQLCYAFAQSPDFVPNADWDRMTSTLRHRRWVAVNDIAYVYEFSGGFGIWESAAPVAVYRRRFDDQTEEVMLVFPSRPPSNLGFFRVRPQ